MNERYLFRGKRLDNGECEVGYRVHDDLIRPTSTGCSLSTTDARPDGWFECMVFQVDPDTLGQCTGLRDKNGKLIFEGDIIETGMSSNTVRCDIQYREGSFCAVSFRYDDEYYLSDSHDYVEIIGNIYDNPELLEGEREA